MDQLTSKHSFSCTMLHNFLEMTLMKNFTLIIKPTTIRVVLFFAVINKCYIHNLMKNALLIELVKRIVFIERSLGFTNPKFQIMSVI